jgi:PAS domain-containing protein
MPPESLLKPFTYRDDHEPGRSAGGAATGRQAPFRPGHAVEAPEAAPTDCWVLTDPRGVVLEASPAAAHLLGITDRNLVGRNLYLFFDQERTRAMNAGHAAPRSPLTFMTRVRPRERKPRPVQVSVQADSDALIPNLCWRFETFTNQGSRRHEASGRPNKEPAEQKLGTKEKRCNRTMS